MGSETVSGRRGGLGVLERIARLEAEVAELLAALELTPCSCWIVDGAVFGRCERCRVLLARGIWA